MPNSALLGPFDWNALRQLHKAGVISDATEVARTGTDEWTRYADAVLVEKVLPEPLPPPPVPKPLLRRDESAASPAMEDVPPSRPLQADVPCDKEPIAVVTSVVPELFTPASSPRTGMHGMAPTEKLGVMGQAKTGPLPPVPPASAVPHAPMPSGPLFRFPCKSCGGVIGAPASHVGLQVPCPACGIMATVPAMGVGVNVVSSVGTTPVASAVSGSVGREDASVTGEVKPSALSWDVHFGSLLTSNSRTGFVQQGRLHIENGKMLFEGWKLWNKPLRVVIGIVLTLGLMWICQTVMSITVLDKLEGFIVRMFLDDEHQQRPYPEWVLTAVFFVNAILFYVIPVCVAMIVSSHYLALPSKRAFVPATRPKGKGGKLTLKIRPADGNGKSRTVSLCFRNLYEARQFQSHFEQ